MNENILGPYLQHWQFIAVTLKTASRIIQHLKK
jgi:hypothetical protein